MSSQNKPGGGKLSINLNLKPKQITKAFTDEDDHDDTTNPSIVSISKPKTTNFNLNLLAQQAKNTSDKATAQIHEKALEQDKHVFEYDKVYEAMKAHTPPNSRSKNLLSSSEPRYVDQLLKSAQVRKLTFLKSQINKFKLDAQATAQQGEQEEEAFVTSSYKTALQEIKAMEMELEDQSQGIQGTTGMHSIYRNFLNQSDSQARQALEPIQPTTIPPPVEPVPEPVTALASVNDSGEVVDKRTLLIKNGLTLRNKPLVQNPTQIHGDKVTRVVKRSSSDRELEDQRPIKVVKKKDEAVISSARERYLARKLAASSPSNHNTS